jgi:transcriptional regulator with XRE-family HTH domain
MQALFMSSAYDPYMATKSRLRVLREAAGLSVRELARQIGEQHTNILYWETSGNPPRSNVLVPMAKALGVTVEELLGQPRAKKTVLPGGRLGKVVETIGRMPRRQQDKIVEVIETFVAGQQSKAA